MSFFGAGRAGGGGIGVVDGGFVGRCCCVTVWVLLGTAWCDDDDNWFGGCWCEDEDAWLGAVGVFVRTGVLGRPKSGRSGSAEAGWAA